MGRESEAALEAKLVSQLQALGYEKIEIRDESEIEANLKTQLEKHNKTTFSDKEFAHILNHLGRGNVFERAKTLRDKMQLTRDNGDAVWIEFLNSEKWCKNLFQVAQQVTIDGTYKNRYDVTILVNGLPLVQIELKRRGLELKEAFNQTNRYQRHSYSSGYGLFQYIQFFVISNGVNTKYYANNRKQSFKQTFYWSDEKNNNITQLDEFTNTFLEPCHMSKMLTKYIVLNETFKILMILRPYQYYATEAIIERVKNSDKNGYIWHTTGSGKTLTSFKASQILTTIPEVKKVVFVVDRKDLDYQTIKEFNSFKKGSVDGTDNTKTLVEQFADPDTKLIVTTIQKLNNAVTYDKHQHVMDKLRDEKVVLIFDECHRSQFGDTHAKIKEHFNGAQMFGFTGTPIFAKNAVFKKTTKDLFDKQLHSYVITDAIRDENVLKFSIEYVGKYRQKADSNNELDIEVEGIDTEELFDSEQRLDKITDYIIANHNRKTHSREFTALFAVGSIDVLIKYYELLKKKKAEGKHHLNIATIYSYAANEEDKDANGLLDDDVLAVIESKNVNVHSRDKLDEFIGDYNEMFGTNYSTKDGQLYYNYYKDIAKRVKQREIDILLVVNMFLTGFDSPLLNTLYVDKNLRYHGLIQAFSRTNRIVNELKSQGNIVSFRNLKKNTDEAVALFSDKDAKETIFLEPYEVYVKQFNGAVGHLQSLAPTVNSVNDLQTEEDELKFVQAFRELMRIMNILSGFADFKFSDVGISEQMYEDYKSKYLDIYDKVRSDTHKEKVSILEDVDFEVELIHRDDINVAYILRLLARLKGADEAEVKKQRKVISDIIAGDIQLRSKQELIEKFIDKNLPKIEDVDKIPEEFASYWNSEKQQAFEEFCKAEGIKPEKLNDVISRFLFTEKEPLNEEIVEMLETKPKLLERQTITQRIKAKIMKLIDVFMTGVPDEVE